MGHLPWLCITRRRALRPSFRGWAIPAARMYLGWTTWGALPYAGAALGTTLAQGISVIVSLGVILRRKSGIRLHKSDLRPQKNVIGRILRIGVPVALQDGLIQISFLLITVIANRRGLTDAAAVGIVEKIISFIFLVPSSMPSTVSALGAQNVGKGTFAAGQRNAIGISLTFLSLSGHFIITNAVALFAILCRCTIHISGIASSPASTSLQPRYFCYGILPICTTSYPASGGELLYNIT